MPCYTGDLDAGQRALAPLRTLAGHTPLADTTGPIPYPALYELTAMAAVSRPHAIRNAYLRGLTDETIEIILDFVDRATSPFGVIALREFGGAMARVPVDATAFAHRDKAFYVAADNAWEDERGRSGTSPGPRRSGRRWPRTRTARTPASWRTRDLDLPELAGAVGRALVRVVPFDGTCLLTMDPATMLPPVRSWRTACHVRGAVSSRGSTPRTGLQQVHGAGPGRNPAGQPQRGHGG